MANFDRSGMTQAGINLMGKAIGGATIQFTKLVLGDGEMTGEILDLQGVVSPKQNVDVTRIERNDNQCTVGGELLTKSVKQGFFWRECGLYAMDPDIGEILYNYAYSTKPDYIAQSDSGMMEEILVAMVATVGSNANVDVTIDDSIVYASKRELHTVNNELDAVKTQKRDKTTKIKRDDLDITSDSAKIGLINLADEVRAAMAGTAPVSPEIEPDYVTSDHIAPKAVKDKNISFNADSEILCTCTLSLLTRDDKSIDITLSGSNKNTGLWLYNANGTYKQSYEMISSKTYNLKSNYMLIWDVESNVLYTQLNNTEKSDSHVILAYNWDGEIVKGALVSYLYHKNIKSIEANLGEEIKEIESLILEREVYVNENYGRTIYIEESKGYNGKVYLKFDTLYVYHKNIKTSDNAKKTTWEQFKLEINNDSRFLTSPKGVEDCLLLNDGEALALSSNLGKFKLVGWLHVNKDCDVVIAQNLFGCAIKGAITDHLYRRLIEENNSGIESNKAKISNIESQLAKEVNYLQLPSYYQEFMDNLIVKSDEFLSSAGENSVVFMTFSDVHCYLKQGYISSFIDYIRNRIGLSAVLFAGDMAVDYYNEAQFRSIRAEIRRHKDISILTVGNHDINKFPENKTMANVHHYFCNNYGTKHGLVTNSKEKNGAYFYYDDPIAHIRYISINLHHALDNSTRKIGEMQLEWLIHVALKAPNGWGYVILSHEPLQRLGIHGHDCQPVNGILLLDILNAINTKKAINVTDVDGNVYNLDYTKTDNFVICACAGHVHYDNLIKHESIPVITTINYGPFSWDDAPSRKKNTTTELAMDLYVVNTQSRTCKVFRIGAGSDREFKY